MGRLTASMGPLYGRTPVTRHLPTEERRAQILAAARTCFLEGGYHATRVQQIARTAGLSKGAVYFHFENKRALLEALVEDEFARAQGIFDEAERSPVPLASMAQAFLGFLGEPGDPRHRFFVLTGELAVEDAELRGRLRGHHEGLLARMAAVFERFAAEAGRPLGDPLASAVLVKAMADGLQGAFAMGFEFDRSRLLMAALGLLQTGLLGAGGEGARQAATPGQESG